MLDGIQKRLDQLVDPAELRRRLRAALVSESQPSETRDGLEQRLPATRRRIGRLVEALADGQDDLPSVRAALSTLERERARLEAELVVMKIHCGARDRLDRAVETMMGVLGNVREVLQAGAAEERKEVVRLFVKAIRVEAARNRVVLQWYQMPRGAFVKLVPGAAAPRLHDPRPDPPTRVPRYSASPPPTVKSSGFTRWSHARRRRRPPRRPPLNVQDAANPLPGHIIDDDPGESRLERAEQAADEVEDGVAGLGTALDKPPQTGGFLGEPA